MSFDDWLDSAGFVADPTLDDVLADVTGVAGASDEDDGYVGHDDDPWGAVAIELTPLSDAQRRFLLGDDELAAADDAIIEFPADDDLTDL